MEALREKAKAAAQNKKKRPARRNRVKVLMYKDMISALKPTPSAAHPCDDLVDGFLADLPPPTTAALAALPAAIGMLLSTCTRQNVWIKQIEFSLSICQLSLSIFLQTVNYLVLRRDAHFFILSYFALFKYSPVSVFSSQ